MIINLLTCLGIFSYTKESCRILSIAMPRGRWCFDHSSGEEYNLPNISIISSFIRNQKTQNVQNRRVSSRELQIGSFSDLETASSRKSTIESDAPITISSKHHRFIALKMKIVNRSNKVIFRWQSEDVKYIFHHEIVTTFPITYVFHLLSTIMYWCKNEWIKDW